MFRHGDQNRHLSGLDRIAAQGVRVVPIEQCSRFPMDSTAPALWRALRRFLDEAAGQTCLTRGSCADRRSPPRPTGHTQRAAAYWPRDSDDPRTSSTMAVASTDRTANARPKTS